MIIFTAELFTSWSPIVGVDFFSRKFLINILIYAPLFCSITINGRDQICVPSLQELDVQVNQPASLSHPTNKPPNHLTTQPPIYSTNDPSVPIKSALMFL